MSLCDEKRSYSPPYAPAEYEKVSFGINTVNSYGYNVDLSGNWLYKEDNLNVKVQGVDIYYKELPDILKRAAKDLNLDWLLVASICCQESTFNPNRPPKDDHHTASGLWQFIKGTWEWVGKSIGYPNFKDALNPEISTNAFVYYMGKNLINSGNGDNNKIAIAIQRHHDGCGAAVGATEWANRKLTKDYMHDKESKEYVKNILDRYRKYSK